MGNPEQIQPSIMIVGAGLAGVMLGLLLERLGMQYFIFERSAQVKPLGSVMSINANILPVFEQLGLLDEVLSISKPCESMEIYNLEMKKIAELVMHDYKEMTGYSALVFPRPKLYQLMVSRIPSFRLHLGKKVLAIDEKKDHILITCSDNSQYRGDIVVGADGAYSGVRQSLFKRMKCENILPKADEKSMEVGYVCMVGTTKPMDPEKYPMLKNETTSFSQVVGKDLQSYRTITVKNNQICWALSVRHRDDEGKDMVFRNSEWAAESIPKALKEFESFPCPLGGVMADLIDATPPEVVSKVFLEEILFETWYHGRTVLIGDACHKMLPAAGQGAIQAMQDAVILANCLYDMKSMKLSDIGATFREYREQRYPVAKAQYDNSKLVTKLMWGQSMSEKILRQVALNFLPEWVTRKKSLQVASYRPQAVFLPTIENRGLGPILPQKPSRRKQEELKEQKAVHGPIVSV